MLFSWTLHQDHWRWMSRSLWPKALGPETPTLSAFGFCHSPMEVLEKKPLWNTGAYLRTKSSSAQSPFQLSSFSKFYWWSFGGKTIKPCWIILEPTKGNGFLWDLSQLPGSITSRRSPEEVSTVPLGCSHVVSIFCSWFRGHITRFPSQTITSPHSLQAWLASVEGTATCPSWDPKPCSEQSAMLNEAGWRIYKIQTRIASSHHIGGFLEISWWCWLLVVPFLKVFCFMINGSKLNPVMVGPIYNQ